MRITCRNCSPAIAGIELEFTSDLRAATQTAQAIFIAVGTPQSQTGKRRSLLC